MRSAILLVSVLILFNAALLGCRRANAPPPPDFTTLKRDLLELDQAIGWDLSRRTALLHPDRFIAALEQLERDVRLQRDKPTGRAQELVAGVLASAQALRHAGALYVTEVAPYGNLTPTPGRNKTLEADWDLLKEAFLAIHPGPNESRIDLAVQQLEAAEHPVSQK